MLDKRARPSVSREARQHDDTREHKRRKHIRGQETTHDMGQLRLIEILEALCEKQTSEKRPLSGACVMSVTTGEAW